MISLGPTLLSFKAPSIISRLPSPRLQQRGARWGTWLATKVVLDIMRNVKPGLPIVGSLMHLGQDACQKSWQTADALSTRQISSVRTYNSLLSYISKPNDRRIASAFPYPVPWHLVPAEIYVNIPGLAILLTNPKIKELGLSGSPTISLI